MPKNKKNTIFFCKECGVSYPKWFGQCSSCKEWNTCIEEIVVNNKSSINSLNKDRNIRDIRAYNLSEITYSKENRITTEFKEFDRVLGGGIVKGSLILVGGDPGIGKSTLLLQISKVLSQKDIKILYVSGEESLKQIKLRASRMGDFSDSLLLLSETDITLIDSIIEKEKPEVLIIDSIQTMVIDDNASSPGSISQVRDVTSYLMRVAKGKDIATFIVGHVTKEGIVAGPRVLEHMVDTVLYFEGDRHASYRILRGVKNRFGSTDEIGVFEMVSTGLKEVLNPSEFMLEGRDDSTSGSIVACQIEGSRPILLEVQSLVTRTAFGMPRRTSAGIDYNRINLLMAVLEKRVGLHLFDFDAYVNVVGGFKISEPAIDLPICLAIVSSYKNISIDKHTIAFGEIGLSGEVRSVSMADKRIKESMKLGFNTIIMPLSNLNKLDRDMFKGIELIGVKNISEAVQKI